MGAAVKAKPQFEGLIQRARKGDEAAVSELVTLVQDRLFRYCVMLTHRRELAEDICQETLLKAFSKLDRLKNPEAFLGWLYQLAKNLYVDQIRLKSSGETPLEKMTDRAGPSADADTVMTVQKVLSQFETEDRHLLLLVELEGYSYREAAEIIGITEDALRSRLHRIRVEFKNIFENRKRNLV